MSVPASEDSASEEANSFGYRQVLPVLSCSFDEFFETNYFARKTGVFANYLKKKHDNWTFDFMDYEAPVLLEAALVSEKFFGKFKLIRNYFLRPVPKKMFIIENKNEKVILTEKFMIHLKNNSSGKKQMVVAFIGEESENTSYNVIRVECDLKEFENLEKDGKGHSSYIMKDPSSIPEDDPQRGNPHFMTRQVAGTIDIDLIGSTTPFVIYTPETGDDPSTDTVRVFLFTKLMLEGIANDKRAMYQKAISSETYKTGGSFEVTVTPGTKYYDSIYESRTPSDSFFRSLLHRSLGKGVNDSVFQSELSKEEEKETDGFFDIDPLKNLSELLSGLYQVPIWQSRKKQMLSVSENDESESVSEIRILPLLKSGFGQVTGLGDSTSSKYWFSGTRGKYTGTLKNTEKLIINKEYLDKFGKKDLVDKSSIAGKEEKVEKFILVSRYLPGEHSRYLVRLILAFTGRRVTTVRQVRNKYGLEYMKRSLPTELTNSTSSSILQVFTEHYLSEKIRLDTENTSHEGALTSSSLRRLTNALLKHSPLPGGKFDPLPDNPLVNFSLDWELDFDRFNLRQNLLIPNAYLVSLFPSQSEEKDYAMFTELFTYSLYRKFYLDVDSEFKTMVARKAEELEKSLINPALVQLLNITKTKQITEFWMTKRGNKITLDEYKLLNTQIFENLRFLEYKEFVSTDSKSWVLVLYVASSLKKSVRLKKYKFEQRYYEDFLNYRKELEKLETSTSTVSIRTFSFNLYSPKLYIFFAYKKMKSEHKQLIELMSLGNNVFFELMTVQFRKKNDNKIGDKDVKDEIQVYDPDFRDDNKTLTWTQAVGFSMIDYKLYGLLSNDYLETKVFLLRSPKRSEVFLYGESTTTKCTFYIKFSRGRWGLWDLSEFSKVLKIQAAANKKNSTIPTLVPSLLVCKLSGPEEEIESGVVKVLLNMFTYKVTFIKKDENAYKLKVDPGYTNLKTVVKILDENDEYTLIEEDDNLIFESSKVSFEAYRKESSLSTDSIVVQLTAVTYKKSLRTLENNIDKYTQMNPSNFADDAGNNPVSTTVVPSPVPQKTTAANTVNNYRGGRNQRKFRTRKMRKSSRKRNLPQGKNKKHFRSVKK